MMKRQNEKNDSPPEAKTRKQEGKVAPVSVDSGYNVPGRNMKDRAKFALEAGLWVDCKFIVGTKRQEMAASKYFLALSSPVFEAMFFGDLATTEPIQVPQVEPEVFTKLLQFTYCNSFEFDSVAEAFSIYEAADYYMMPELNQFCVSYMLHVIHPDSHLLHNMLTFATRYNDQKLIQAVIQEIQINADTLLSSPSVQNLEPDFLVTILLQDHLDVTSEFTLVEAAVRWATARCEAKGFPVIGANLRGILKEAQVFEHLRFLTLTETELCTIHVTMGILTSEEVVAIIQHFSTDNSVPLPDSICPTTNFRESLKQREDCAVLEMKKAYDEDTQGYKREVKLKIPHSGGVLSLGVTISPQTCVREQASSLKEDVTISVEGNCSEHGEKEETKVGSFLEGTDYKGQCHLLTNFNEQATKQGRKWHRTKLNFHKTSEPSSVRNESNVALEGDKDVEVQMSYAK